MKLSIKLEVESNKMPRIQHREKRKEMEDMKRNL